MNPDHAPSAVAAIPRTADTNTGGIVVDVVDIVIDTVITKTPVRVVWVGSGMTRCHAPECLAVGYAVEDHGVGRHEAEGGGVELEGDEHFSCCGGG